MIIAGVLVVNIGKLEYLTTSHLPVKEYIRSSIPLVLSNLVASIHGLVHTVFASLVGVAALSTTGYMIRSYFIYGSLVIAINSAGSIRLNRFGGETENSEKYYATLKTQLTLSAIAALLCLLIFCVFAETLMAPISNPSTYSDNVTYCRWMGVSYALLTIANPFHLALISLKKGKEVFFSTVATVGCGVLVATLVFYLTRSLLALGISAVITEIVYLCMVLYYFKKSINIGIRAFLEKKIADLSNLISYLKDAGNLLIAHAAINTVDYLIFALFIKDENFLAIMALYFAANASVQGICLGFASSAAVDVSRAIQKSIELKSLLRTIVIYAVVIALICSLIALAVLFFSVFIKNKLIITSTTFILFTTMVFFVSASTYLSRSVLRSGGDTAFLKKFSLVTSLGLKLPWAIAISQTLNVSQERTHILLLGYSAISAISLVILIRRSIRFGD
jgi:Na+-driven multidrug efflux pump